MAHKLKYHIYFPKNYIFTISPRMCPFITLWLSTLKMITISLSKIKCKFDVTLVGVFQLDFRVGHFLTPCIFLAGSYVTFCLCVLCGSFSHWASGPCVFILHLNFLCSVSILGYLQCEDIPPFFYLCFLIFPLSTQAYDLLVCLFISIDIYIWHLSLVLLNLSSVALFGC